MAARDIADVIFEVIEERLASKADLEASAEKTRAVVQRQIEKAKAETVKWVAGMLVAQAAIVATMVKLL